MSSSAAERGADRRAWEREYAEVQAYTTSFRDELDRGVEFVLGFLRARGEALAEPVLECACGRGRNLLPLAALGHAVLGLDHAFAALRQFRDRAEREGTAGRAAWLHHDLRRTFPLADGSVGTVLDITAVDNLVRAQDRDRYAREIVRVLRPGGLLAVVTFDRDDGYYRRFLKEPRRADESVVEDPNTGIRNRLFRAADLDRLFTPGLRLVAANRFDFIDEAAEERWTRRFHLRLYRGPGGEEPPVERG